MIDTVICGIHGDYGRKTEKPLSHKQEKLICVTKKVKQSHMDVVCPSQILAC